MFTTFNPKWRSPEPSDDPAEVPVRDPVKSESLLISEACGNNLIGSNPTSSSKAEKALHASPQSKIFRTPAVDTGTPKVNVEFGSRRGEVVGLHSAAIPDIEDLVVRRRSSYHRGQVSVSSFQNRISTVEPPNYGFATSTPTSGDNPPSGDNRYSSGRCKTNVDAQLSYITPDRTISYYGCDNTDQSPCSRGTETGVLARPNNLSSEDASESVRENDEIAAFNVDGEAIDMAFEWAPMDVYRANRKLSVTDFSGLLWCEQQVEYMLVTGKKRETVAMKSGVERHKRLELLDHEVVEVEVETAEDALGLRMLNTMTLLDQLTSTGKAREVWIFAIASDKSTVLRGVIDELSLEFDESLTCEEVVISDTKTRQVAREPSDAQKRTSAFQLQLYRWMLEKLRTGDIDFDLLWRRYKCNCDSLFKAVELNAFENLAALRTVFVEKLAKLPRISSNMDVVYECDAKVFARTRLSYCRQSTEYALNDMLAWWRGLRRGQGVVQAEKWKCKMCDFVSDCTQTPLSPHSKAAAAARAKEIEAASKTHPKAQCLSGESSAGGASVDDSSSTPEQGEIASRSADDAVDVASPRCAPCESPEVSTQPTPEASAHLICFELEILPTDDAIREPSSTRNFGGLGETESALGALGVDTSEPLKPHGRTNMPSATGPLNSPSVVATNGSSDFAPVFWRREPFRGRRFVQDVSSNCVQPSLGSRFSGNPLVLTHLGTPNLLGCHRQQVPCNDMNAVPQGRAFQTAFNDAILASPPRKRRLRGEVTTSRSATVTIHHDTDRGVFRGNQTALSYSAPPPPLESPHNRLAAQ